MKESARAQEYAKTINVLTKGSFDAHLRSIQTIVAQLKASQKLAYFFLHPAIPAARKIALVDHMAGEQVPDLIKQVIHGLIFRQSISLLALIAEELEILRKKNQNRMDVIVTSAVTLTDQQKNAINERLSAVTAKRITADYRVDASLIGGLRLHIGDRTVDNSLKSRIETMTDMLFIASLQ
jgi:F-type H+-transporting ATPase subunit delta